MTSPAIHRDERAVLIENASFRWAYLVISFGLLVLAAYRSFAWGERPWDLLALVMVGGGVAAVYQGYHHVLRGRRAALMLAAAVAAALVAAAAVAIG